MAKLWQALLGGLGLGVVDGLMGAANTMLSGQVNHELAEEDREFQQNEASNARNWQTQERLDSQNYNSVEAALARDWQSEENKSNRDWQTSANKLAMEFSSHEAPETVSAPRLAAKIGLRPAAFKSAISR